MEFFVSDYMTGENKIIECDKYINVLNYIILSREDPEEVIRMIFRDVLDVDVCRIDNINPIKI
jgi:hypothetical protein